MIRDKIWKLWLIGGGTAIVMYSPVARMIPLGTEIEYFFIGAGTPCRDHRRHPLNHPAGDPARGGC